MTLKACPQCGYRYNAPENQTCGKCKGWLGAPAAGGAAAVAAADPRHPLVPRSLTELLCYLPVLLGAFLGFPNPIGAAFGLLMASLLLKAVRLDMERFSKSLLIGIVIAAVFLAYLIFLLLFYTIWGLLGPVLASLVQWIGHLVKR